MRINRRAIYERDEGLCGICGEPVPWAELHVDHILPRMLGGADVPANLRTAHQRCNYQRGAADARTHDIHRGRPGAAYQPDHLSITLDPATKRRLDALSSRLELRRPDVVRQAIRAYAEQLGLEPRPDAP